MLPRIPRRPDADVRPDVAPSTPARVTPADRASDPHYTTDVRRGGEGGGAIRPELRTRATDRTRAAGIGAGRALGTIPVGELTTTGAPREVGELPARRGIVPPEMRRAPRPHESHGPSVARPDPRIEPEPTPRGRGAFSGPIVGPGQLDEATESRILAEHGNHGTLAAYGGFDAERPPVILVHGIHDSPDRMRDIAAELDRRGMQVMVFFYDDTDTRTHSSGSQLAEEMTDLRGLYGEDASIDIVAHSMGGLVTRSALNDLAQPGWYEGDPSTDGANPRAGFDSIRFRALDTAWTGYPHEPGAMSSLVEGFLDTNGMEAMTDMRGNSQMFQHLFDPALDGVDLQTTAAFNIPSIHGRDAHRSVHDMNADQRAQLVAWLDGGPSPTDEAANHLASAWAQDSRFGALRTEVRAAVASGELDRDGDPGDLAAVADRVMPSANGSHNSILTDAPHHRSLVDDLADDLAPRPTTSS